MLQFQLQTYVPIVQTVSLTVADGQKSLKAPVPKDKERTRYVVTEGFLIRNRKIHILDSTWLA